MPGTRVSYVVGGREGVDAALCAGRHGYLTLTLTLIPIPYEYTPLPAETGTEYAPPDFRRNELQAS